MWVTQKSNLGNDVTKLDSIIHHFFKTKAAKNLIKPFISTVNLKVTYTIPQNKNQETTMATFSTVTASGLLGPVLALNGWTFIIEGLMYATRIPTFQRLQIGFDPNIPSEQVNAKIPPSVRWKADNYNHLTEQPTQFYAVALSLAIIHGTLGTAEKTDVMLAWSYVGVRILHSFVQCTSNNVMRRFSVFLFSSGILATMTARAAALLWK